MSGSSITESTRTSTLLTDCGATGTQNVQSTTPTTGQGNVGQTGPTPDAPPPNMMGAVMESLGAMMPKISGQMLDLLLLQITTQMKETISKTEKDKIETDTGAKRVQIGEKQAKLEEAAKKIQEAEDKMKNMSVWDKIKLAFQYIGAIMSIIAGVFAILAGVAAGAFTGGATAIAGIVGGAMLITAGILMLGMAADATYAMTNKDGLGFVGAITKEIKMDQGMSEEDALASAQKADMIAKITVGVLAAVLAIGGSIAAAFVATPALVGTVMSVIGAVNTVAMATGDITVAVLRNDAQQDKADGIHKQADGKKMEALIQSLDDMIDLAMARLKGAMNVFDGMLDALTDAIQDRGNTMGRVGLKG